MRIKVVWYEFDLITGEKKNLPPGNLNIILDQTVYLTKAGAQELSDVQEKFYREPISLPMIRSMQTSLQSTLNSLLLTTKASMFAFAGATIIERTSNFDQFSE